MTTRALRRNCRLLVVNPNCSHDMTHGMERAIRFMGLPSATEITMYTAPPNAPASINNADDLKISSEVVWGNLNRDDALGNYDGVLIACYSAHPLVNIISQGCPDIAVAGIFEASVLATLPLLRRRGWGGHWGIVTTGKFWEDHLTEAVKEYLGQENGDRNRCFLGVQSTGLDAGDFHGHVSPEIIRDRLGEATKRLLRSGRVDCVVMGCAGMAGLEAIIRSAAIDEYGETRAKGVYVIDGVRAGIGVLEQMVNNKRMFQDA